MALADSETRVIPVVWVSYRQPEIIARGYWDQGLFERLLARRLWWPVDALQYEHVDGFDQLSDDFSGAVVVVPAQHHHLSEEIERLNRDLARLEWVLLVLSGDECSLLDWRKLSHPNMGLWVMTPRPHLHASCEARFVGEGFHVSTPDVLAEFAREAAQRPVAWFFAGQVTHERRRLLSEALRAVQPVLRGDLVETPGFLQGLEHRDYLRRMSMAKIAPCPAGPCTPDSFRLYEALEAGCVPLADARTPEGTWDGFWSFVYGDVPFPIVEDWAQVHDVIDQQLAQWPQNANRCFSWWQQQKRSMSYALDDDVRALSGELAVTDSLRDLITVVMPTSAIPSHPSTRVIDETLQSLDDAGLDRCEKLIMCDGVRDELAHRRESYGEFLRTLLWECNHRRMNTLPIVFDEHLHQAEMTRRTLPLVRTPLVLFVEHDTPLVGEIPWWDLVRALSSHRVDLIRLHHEASVLVPHRHLMVDQEPRDVQGVPMQRTAQWSQRPHLATLSYYRRIISTHFRAQARTMIEDLMHGVVATQWTEYGRWGEHKLWLYTPEGDIKRSTHLDGRESDPKFEMVF